MTCNDIAIRTNVKKIIIVVMMKNEILRRQGRDIFVQQTALRIIYSVKSTSVNVHRSRMISLTNRIEAHCKKNSFAVGGTNF